MVSFAKWMDDFCPADPKIQYLSSYEGAGVARPWMLSWRSDFGLAGYFEKETCEQLVELIVSEGMRTDPNLVAVEKLACTMPPQEYLDSEYTECQPLLESSSLLRPFSLAYIKGWKRSVALLITLQGIRELQLDQNIEHFIRVTMGSIYVNLSLNAADARSKVQVSRGATLASVVRKAPNCFNLLRQMEVMQRSGCKASADKILEDWSNAAAVAKAFQIGKLEAGAVCALMSGMDPKIRKRLCESVRPRGMKGFITHDMVSKQIFNDTFTSGVGSAECWAMDASNKNGRNLADRFITRLEYTFDNTPPQLRKAMPFKDAARIHLATGLFTCCLEKFSETVPPGEFKQLKPSLESQFDAGYMDGELLHIADDQVPPLDLRSVAAFRQHLARIEQNIREEKDTKAQEYKRQVAAASFAMIESQIKGDMEALKSVIGDSSRQASESAKDLKYVRDRTGKNYVDKWMAEHCKLIEGGSDVNASLAHVMAFLEQFRGAAGNVFLS
ncbi:unnamed protein product [Durusdinium trenchii]|uniref:Uncharacterized protein n=1 Tax=Durusdinium trenchii TaxID=1381693 RepID=A0ABP0QM53_9DINO